MDLTLENIHTTLFPMVPFSLLSTTTSKTVQGWPITRLYIYIYIVDYFCAFVLISVEKNILWAVLPHMETQDGINFQLSRHIQVVYISTSFRLAAGLHKCDNNGKLLLNNLFEHPVSFVNGSTRTTTGQKEGILIYWITVTGYP